MKFLNDLLTYRCKDNCSQHQCLQGLELKVYNVVKYIEMWNLSNYLRSVWQALSPECHGLKVRKAPPRLIFFFLFLFLAPFSICRFCSISMWVWCVWTDKTPCGISAFRHGQSCRWAKLEMDEAFYLTSSDSLRMQINDSALLCTFKLEPKKCLRIMN